MPSTSQQCEVYVAHCSYDDYRRSYGEPGRNVVVVEPALSCWKRSLNKTVDSGETATWPCVVLVSHRPYAVQHPK